MAVKFVVTDTREEAGCKAADCYEKLIEAKPDCVIGLATGSTPLPLYDELARRCSNGKIDFSAVRSVNLDEYVGLGVDHVLSYRYFMNKNLFDRININKSNTAVPDGLAADPAAECAAYEAHIQEMGGIDLQLLGIGHDGHIGFNEPDEIFPGPTHITQLTEMTRKANSRFFASLDDVPCTAITCGIGTIMGARQIVMIITGSDKADILQKTFKGPVTPQIPASILQFHQNITVFCDKEAYAKMED